jgi:hypothetical protein
LRLTTAFECDDDMAKRDPKAGAASSVRCGDGMIEVLVATVIVGVMVVAALNSLAMVARPQRLNADRLTGPGLAQSLMAEIMSQPYTDPQQPGTSIGVDAGESSANRATFDDVDDYHGFYATDLKTKEGSNIPGYTGWTRSATVTWAERYTGTAWGSYDTNLKRITVTVTSPSGAITQLVTLRSKHGALEQSLPRAGTAVAWLGIELRTGASTRSQFAATPLANLTADAN